MFHLSIVMPIVGRKYHMAGHGVFRLNDGVGTIDLD
jgi:hypothetical protein